MALMACSCQRKIKADLILHHGKIYTVDSAFSTAEAFAVRDGKIIAVGTNDEILSRYEATNMQDAHSQPVYPGFIDAHSHFLGYGRSLFEVNLYGCNNWDEALERVKTFATAHPGEAWILGRGWDQNKFPGHAYPDNIALSKLFPDKPVLLQRVDGHAALANITAMKMAIRDSAMLDLEGGTIEVKNDLCTGILIDNAVDLVTRIIPKPGAADYEKWLVAAAQNCFRQGLTTVADCGLMYDQVAAMDTLQQEGKLAIRLYIMLSDDTANLNRYLPTGPYKTDRMYVKGIKAYADGALGSRGACLLAPYTDKPGWYGFLLSRQSHFDSLAALLINTQFQLCTHAIGDSGNRMILNVYNKYLKGKNDKRWRVEHCQVVNAADFHLFGAASIIPSVQPTHATSDMYWVRDRLGASGRIAGAYAYKQLLEQNGWLPLGTDFPVEDISPVKTFYAAVTRKDASGFPPGGFQVENALTREQALRGITIWAAKAGFLEHEVGSIEVGKKADFVILDRDLMQVADSALLGAKVLGTWVGGKKED